MRQGRAVGGDHGRVDGTGTRGWRRLAAATGALVVRRRRSGSDSTVWHEATTAPDLR